MSQSAVFRRRFRIRIGVRFKVWIGGGVGVIVRVTVVFFLG